MYLPLKQRLSGDLTCCSIPAVESIGVATFLKMKFSNFRALFKEYVNNAKILRAVEYCSLLKYCIKKDR